MSELGPDRNHIGDPLDASLIDGGGDHVVEAAVDSLRAVARREQRALQPNTITAIAQAAAAERAGSPAPGQAQLPPAPVIDVTPLAPVDPSGLRPRPARSRSVLALAAALLVASGIGGAVLTAAPQQVETQDSAASGSPRQQSDLVDPAEAQRPVLDLGESLPTTAVASPIDADKGETSASAPEAEADRAPSTTAPPPPSSASSPASAGARSATAPPATAPPATMPPAATPPTTRPPTQPPDTVTVPASDGRALALQLGVAGTVELLLDDSRPTLGRVMAMEGWSGRTTTPRPDGFGYQLTDGYSVASVVVWSEPGWFNLDVDHGGRWPSSTEWNRTIRIDRAGTVDVRHGTHGLSGLEIQLSPGWRHRVDSVGADHLLVVITSPDRTSDHEFRVDAGPATIDFRITGS